MQRKLLLLWSCVTTLSYTASKKCEFVIKRNTVDHVRCKFIDSFEEVFDEIQPTWKNVVVDNNPERNFRIVEHPQAHHFAYIGKLDLSNAGNLILSDHGFKEFRSLWYLDISKTRLDTFKISWFTPENVLEDLNMSKNRLRTLNRVDLGNLKRMKFANFSYNELENIERNTFADLIRLETLDLSFNRLKNIGNIGEIPRLKKLIITDNEMDVVSSNAFRGMPYLEELHIPMNSIRKIEDRAFDGLDRLKVLNISGNSVQNIQKNIFAGLSGTRLYKLDLSQNDILSIDPQGFQELPLLQTLNLSGNSLSELNQFSFDGLRSLRKLYLSQNDIATIRDDTFANLQSLAQLDLSANNLRTINGKMFGENNGELRKLLLTTNEIESVDRDTFTDAPNIEYLHLGYNSIKFLHDNSLRPLIRLKKLFLGHNLLEEISSNLLNELPSDIAEILINHNKLTFLPDFRHNFQSLVKATVEGNPWQCPCLDEIINFFVGKNVNYYREDYYDGKKPVCVVTSSKSCVKDINFARDNRIVELYENDNSNDV